MEFSRSTPPRYDVESLKRYETKVEPDYTDKFLVCGYSKGSIIFVKIQDMERIYTRFSIHREAVIMVKELHEAGHFVSMCSEYVFNIWGFTPEDETIKVYRTFNLL